MHMLSSITITAKRDDILETLRMNRKKHASIVEEARKGYMAKAKEALAARMDDLAKGKIVSLQFSLTPPQDHTKVYDTAIKMLELHQEDTVALMSDQVRMLIMDEWDWQRGFLGANARYSGTAAAEFRKYDDGES